jgi:hypothetical protein
MTESITELGFKLVSNIMGDYVFKRQVGDNVIGYFEVLQINTRTEQYMFYKEWGRQRKAIFVPLVLHVAINKFLRKIGLTKYEQV